MDEINYYVLLTESSKPLVVTANVGYGKSALLSTWIDKREQKDHNDALVYVFVGASEESTSVYLDISFSKSYFLVADKYLCFTNVE